MLPTTDRPARHGIASLAVDVRPLTQSRDLRLLWTGQAVSFLGSMVTFVAVGLLSLADAIPLLVFGVSAGRSRTPSTDGGSSS